MKEKQHIDAFFKDRFKDHKAEPGPHVWENIRARLDEEKSERKVIPIWIKIGGIAALLAVLLMVSRHFFFPAETDTLLPVTVEDSVSDWDSPRIVTENNLRTEKPQEKSSKTENSKAAPAGDSQKHDAGAADMPAGFEKSDTAISEVKQLPGESEKGKESESGEALVRSEEKPSQHQTVPGEEIATAKGEEKEKQPADKKSIFDAIAEQQDLKQDQEVQKQKEPRWSILPNVAPVYYSSLSKGSSVDPSLADSPHKGDVNLSYGIQVSYALSDKVSIRTGINNVDLSYSTSNIVIGVVPASRGLQGVSYSNGENVVTAASRGNLTAHSTNEFGGLILKSTAGNARLIQNINYLEVPLELKYALVDSRLGINLIGGMSTLFLNNNEISVRAQDFSQVLGEANNLSSISFSTNIGLGLNYRLTRKLTFNMEPMFKYQVNPYSESSVDFKPFYLGVYSGFSIRF